MPTGGVEQGAGSPCIRTKEYIKHTYVFMATEPRKQPDVSPYIVCWKVYYTVQYVVEVREDVSPLAFEVGPVVAVSDADRAAHVLPLSVVTQLDLKCEML